MKKITKITTTYHIDNEEEAAATIEDCKSRQYEENYTVLKTKTDYKPKKDRKTGEIIDELWVVEVTVGYE